MPSMERRREVEGMNKKEIKSEMNKSQISGIIFMCVFFILSILYIYKYINLFWIIFAGFFMILDYINFRYWCLRFHLGKSNKEKQ